MGEYFFWPAMLVAVVGVLSSCDNKDLEGQPEWLGNSIYERLQEDGHFSTTLQLIEDLDYAQVLRQTGSKTVFVADDDAYATWFQSNPWGVRSYGQLSQYDSVARWLPAQMPQTSYWDAHRGKTQGIVLLKDNISQPMIHFLPPSSCR